MIRFSIINGDEGFMCKGSCPAMEYFEPHDEYLEAPDIYDDYFRQYASSRFEQVQKSGVKVLDGSTSSEFWEFLMDMAIYTGDKIFDDTLVEGYERAREYINGMDDGSGKKRKKRTLLEKLGIVHAKLRKPGEEIDSLESFGAFIHLLIAGTSDYMGNDDIRIEIIQEEDLNKAEDLAPFLSYFEDKE